jgi:hypothetical protein
VQALHDRRRRREPTREIGSIRRSEAHGTGLATSLAAGGRMSKELKLHISEDNVITIADSSGGITLKNGSGAMIVIDASGITLDNGKGAKITLSGATVDVNSGALSVT